MTNWISAEQLFALLLSAAIGALAVYVWSYRRQRRERESHALQLSQLEQQQRRTLGDLEQQHSERIARFEAQIAQLRTEHQLRGQELERRLEHQAQFDPHRWIADARALRNERHETAAMQALFAGMERTRDALRQTYLELALHHFVLRVGLPADRAAAHLNAADRYTQLAMLVDSNDRIAALLTEDVSMAKESAEIRIATELPVPLSDVEDPAEDQFLGEPSARHRLVQALTREAARSEAAGRLIVAERLAFRALAIALHELGADAPETIAVRDVYARTLLGNGAYAEARAEIETALQACSRLGLDSAERAFGLRAQRAQVLAHLGRWELALVDLDALLILCEQRSGVEYRETLNLRRERALALSALGHADAALHEIDATLAVLDRVGEQESPESTQTRAARAEILNRLGRSAEALQDLERLLPLAERIFGVEHRIVLTMRWQLALVLHELHRDDEALDDIEWLLATQQSVLGSRHPAVLQSAALRARVMHALGRRDEALLEARRLLPLHASSLGNEHRETLQLSGLVRELEAA